MEPSASNTTPLHLNQRDREEREGGGRGSPTTPIAKQPPASISVRLGCSTIRGHQHHPPQLRWLGGGNERERGEGEEEGLPPLASIFAAPLHVANRVTTVTCLQRRTTPTRVMRLGNRSEGGEGGRKAPPPPSLQQSRVRLSGNDEAEKLVAAVLRVRKRKRKS